MKKHLINVSPWLLGAAFALLALIITVFALNNYEREKVLMHEALERQADVVGRIVNSSIRKSLFDVIRKREREPDVSFYIQRAVEQAQEQEGIAAVFIVDETGKIVAGSSKGSFDEFLVEEDKKFIQQLFKADGQRSVSRKVHRDNNPAVFQFGKVVNVETITRPKPQQRFERPNLDHHNHRPNNRLERLSMRLEEMIGEKSFALFITIDSDPFGSGLEKHKKQLIVLSIVLLLVGSGGWLTLLALQGLKGFQTRLAQLSAFNDRLVSSIPVGIIGVGSDNRIKIVNDKALRILNVREENISFEEYTVAIPEWSEDIKKSLQDNSSIEVQDDENTIIQLYATHINSEQRGNEGFVVVLQDLTEQRNLEEELQRNSRLASLGKVAAGVAHELRNPLSSIKGLSKLLQTRFEEDSDDRQTTDVLVAEIDRLNRSISELIDFAKPQELEFETLDLVNCINKAVQLVQYDADQLEIAIDISNEVDSIYVTGNIDKLNQVFLNLLLNAVQAIDHEKGLISIKYEKRNELVVITVADNGGGLDEAIRDKVFDPYFTTKSEGTGLGLSMCSKIIEEHGGDIKISGNKGQGCSVSVQLPLS